MRHPDAVGRSAAVPGRAAMTMMPVVAPPDPIQQDLAASFSSAPDLCRISVFGPGGRVDLAVPSSATFGLLLPVVARHLNKDSNYENRWVLQRLGESPLAPDSTPDLADLHDGDVLYLRVATEPIPELRYDDLAEGVADSIAARPDRWRPESTRRTFVGLTALALAILGAVAVLAGGSGALLAGYCGALALALGGGAVAIERAVGDRALAFVPGIAACVLAVLAGLAGPQATADMLAPGASGVLLAGLCLVMVAAALGIATRGGIGVYGTATLLGLCAVLGSVLVSSAWTDVPGAAGSIAVGLFLFATFGPRLAARLARLRVPSLPRTNEELQEDIDPVSAAEVAARSSDADGYLTSLIVASAVMSLVAGVLVMRAGGWIAWALPLALGTAALLRARSVRSLWQRGATVWAGSLIITVVILNYAITLTPGALASLFLGVLAVASALAVGAWRLPSTRPLPIWGQVAESAELWTAIALVPLLLVVLGTYGFFRALAG